MASKRVINLIKDMTIDEKIGQLMQIHPTMYAKIKEDLNLSSNLTGVVGDVYFNKKDMYNLGSILTTEDAQTMMSIQKDYVENHRLSIPLLFMYDVIHGYKTIFPINLAMSSSWDPELIRKSSEIAAIESSISGHHVTFAPMCDLSRDPRWGRVMESPGEDHYLNSLMSAACVKGLQGKSLSDRHTMVACTKHFAGYGAAEGGRDYNTVDISDRWLREYYLPAYKAAIDAGSKMVMTSFNIVDSIPATVNAYLTRDILRGEWNFDGVLISDWNSVSEVIVHGAAEDEADCAKKAITAGLDIEMVSSIYYNNLKVLVDDGTVDIGLINESVERILTLKEELGLFENPYRFADEAEEKRLHLCDEHRAVARQIAAESMVLLKNDNVLPLDKNIKKLAIIGPLGDTGELLGPWRGLGDSNDTVTLREGIANKIGSSTEIKVIKGCDYNSLDKSHFPEALAAAKDAEVIILAIGEQQDMSGESKCRTSIDLPGVQQELVAEILTLNKPTVMVLFNGRPLSLGWYNHYVPAILEAWYPGTEGGNAIADILFGDENPSGKLTMSFPHHVGQIPVYYNKFRTGRPTNTIEYDYSKALGDVETYGSNYIDMPHTPLFPFGYGLSYSTFQYDNLELSNVELTHEHKLDLSVDVTNTSDYDAYEIVQLYIQDIAGSVARPIKELKDFKKVYIPARKKVTVTFSITEPMLRFYTKDMNFQSEKGAFKVFLGPHSEDLLEADFHLISSC